MGLYMDGDNLITFACVRALLLLFNVIFWFSGLSIIWIGIWLQTDLYNYLLISTHYSPYASYVFIIIGMVILFVTSLACACIVKIQPTMLVVYGGFLIMMIFALISLSVYVYTYKDLLLSGVSAGINKDILNYDPAKATSPNGTLIDFVQTHLRCCGNESYLDWNGQAVPKSCLSINLRNHALSSTKILHSYYPLGCSYKLRHYINNNLTTVGVITSAITFFPLFGTIFAISLALMSDKMSYEQIA